MGIANAAQGNSPAKRRLRLLLMVVVAFIVWAGYTFFHQMQNKMETSSKLSTVEAEYDALQTELQKLENQVQLLNDPEYIAQLATKELGMVKEGELQIFSE